MSELAFGFLGCVNIGASPYQRLLNKTYIDFKNESILFTIVTLFT